MFVLEPGLKFNEIRIGDIPDETGKKTGSQNTDADVINLFPGFMKRN